ncbi:MAG: hypothetical protein C0606_01570 [Hyphomicrobiales bacterium]|nr:MAG: hypothetical protein C0606_01570 [Hyphomicrobiales bacterium]
MKLFSQGSGRHRARLKTVLGVGLRVAAILAAIAAVALLLLAWRLSSGSVSLDFMRDHLRERVAASLGDGASVDVSEVSLRWASDEGFVVTVADVHIVSPESGLRIAVPSLDMSVTPADLAGAQLSPSTIVVRTPHFRLPVAPGGADAATAQDAEDSFALASQLLRTIRRTAIERGLERLRIEDGEVALTFGAGTTDRRFWSNIALVAAFDAEKKVLSVEASADGQAGRWDVSAAFTPGENGADVLTLKGTQLAPADFIPAPEALSGVPIAHIPLYPDVEVVFSPENEIADAHAEVVIGAGLLSVGDDEVALLDEARVVVNWDRKAKAFRIEPSVAEFGETRFRFAGSLKATSPDAIDRWRFGIEITDMVLKPRDEDGPPVDIERIVVEGRISGSRRFLAVERGDIYVGGRRVFAAAGSAGIGPAGPSLALAFNVEPISGLLAKRLWPGFAAKPVRRWIMDNLIDAETVSGQAVIALGPEEMDGDPATYGWPDDAMDIAFKVENAVLRTVGDLPPVRIPLSKGRLLGGEFEMTAATASAKTAAGRKADISDIRFFVADVRPPGKDGDLSFRIAGDAPAIGELVAAKPISALKRVGVKPTDLTGAVDGSLDTRIPLVKDVELDDIDWRFVANLSDFASKAPIRGQSVSNANLTVKLDPQLAQVSGRAKFDGLDADVDLIEPLDGSEAAARRGITLVLTDAERKKRGIDLAPLLEGPISVAIDSGPNDKHRTLRVDLTSARVAIPGLEWVKKAGQRGSAELTLAEAESGTDVTKLIVRADGLAIEGSARIDKAGAIQSAKIDKLRAGATKDARLTLTRVGNGFSIRLTADTLDGRPIIRFMLGSGGGNDGDTTDLSIKASVGRIIGLNDASLSSVTLDLTQAGGHTARFDFSGTIGASDRLRASIRPDGGKRNLRMATSNMGYTLRFLDLYTRMRGGQGLLDAVLVGTGRAAGKLQIAKFAIAEDPGLREILKRTQDSSNAKEGARVIPQKAVKTGSATFDKLDVTFSKNGDLLKVGEGVLRGAAVGGTVRGAINLKNQRVDMTGTMVPAYGINNLFGRIPLLGEVVGGGSDGGLIGITFKVEGTIANARVVSNPVSAVAPGIFRKIFEYR